MTTNAEMENLRRQLFGEHNPEADEWIEFYDAEFQVAQALYDLRKTAGLTQRELADRVGTSPSAISRIEDADYEGHSLAMLRRVAQALGYRLELRFVPEPQDVATIPEPQAVAA